MSIEQRLLNIGLRRQRLGWCAVPSVPALDQELADAMLGYSKCLNEGKKQAAEINKIAIKNGYEVLGENFVDSYNWMYDESRVMHVTNLSRCLLELDSLEVVLEYFEREKFRL
ncbi:hypothetical protein [Photobacterium sanguinicancri]|uniref:hypothetical protein n=1 Tax=Photobacterium sanguinicancri TaxID=875932 RepID=UPI003D138304